MSQVTTQQSPATSLPSATQHQVEHLFDAPLTFEEYADHLGVSFEQTRLLKSLFSVIQGYGPAAPEFIVSDLALIGEQMAGQWIREIYQRQKEFDVLLARSVS